MRGQIAHGRASIRAEAGASERGAGGLPLCRVILTVVIPAFNEQATIAGTIARVRGTGLVSEIVVVDDASTDQTPAILSSLKASDLVVLRHENNRGKGAALRTGFQHARGDVVLVQDADAEYDPADYPRLLGPLRDGKADVVFGSRFVGGDAHRVLFYWHSVGNRVLTLASNAFTNLNLTDMECGFKVFRKDVLNRVNIEEERFGFEPEIVAKVARLDVRIFEVGVSYNGRTYAEGKKITWRDGVAALWCIFKYNVLK